MATTAASAMALNVFSRKALSALVSRASEPMAQSLTWPTCSPVDVETSTLTVWSASVGAEDTGLCAEDFLDELSSSSPDPFSRASAVALALGHESS